MRAHAGKVGCGDCLSELASIAMMARTSTVRLESLNASIRRRLIATSTQVATPHLGSLSAELALSKMRTRLLENELPPGHRMHNARQACATHYATTRRHHRRRGGGGAWRAYISKETKGRAKAHFAALGERYRSLPQDENRCLHNLSRAAALAHAAGGAAFGPRQRAIHADEQVAQAEALAIRGTYALLSVRAADDRALRASAQELPVAIRERDAVAR